jgi:tetratricopeptide (TPR) repeat protein
MVFTLAPNTLTRKLNAAQQEPRLVDAALALLDNNLHIAEPLLRAHLKEQPHDIAAIRMMAELAGRIGRYSDAENLLRRALELAPDFMAARSNLATVLYRQNRSVEAVAELEFLLAHDPGHTGNANLKAASHGRLGDYDEALTLYEQVLEKHPEQPKVWMSYGHVLKTVGRQEECIAAYRTALIHAPQLGEVWWSLANLKTVTFEDSDITQMTVALANKNLNEEDKYHLHFAIGKAYEERKQTEIAFEHYEKANALRRDLLPYDSQEIHQLVARAKKIFTKELFARRAEQGCDATDPIFILGMPRAGSTLIEQILASHSHVEGTMELPDIPALAARIGARKGGLESVSPTEMRALGEEYIERTRVQRKTDKPFFIDKLPNNWAHIGLIHLMLPKAKIIDARRHPLASCFSNFKQHFARGQSFAYDLADLGHYYASYVELLAHFDAVLPNRIHRVIYENMVEDSDTQIRQLLAALNLSFEPACLTFFENDRAVRTASSEQVRRPINRDGMDQWQPFDPWLNPLKDALGDVLTAYPEIPYHFE